MNCSGSDESLRASLLVLVLLLLLRDVLRSSSVEAGAGQGAMGGAEVFWIGRWAESELSDES